MAQTGFTPIQLYSTSTAAAAPAAGNLTNSTLGSELAINITDGKLFYKDNANAVQVIGWKTTPTTAGGTGLTTYTAGDLSYYASGTTFTKLAIGTTGQILTSTGSAPQWTTLSGVAVTTFSAGTTGFTPNSATSGAVTLAGTLATTNGGTGLTAFTANQVFYASSTSAIGQSANLTFNGTTLTANTIGAFTLSGTIAGGGNQINNVIIGTSTPLAGSFTTLSASGVATFSAGTVSAPAITTTGDTNTGIFFPAADTIAFTEGGVESMRIDSSGNVGIGTAGFANSGVVALDVGAQAGFVGASNSTFVSNNLYFTSAASVAYKASTGAALYEQNRSLICHIWYTAPSGTAGATATVAERMRINSDGNVLIGKTSATANGGDLQVSSGITFPATQVAKSDPNTLDDYEEGTWTPADASGASLTFTSVTARYTKIGNVVYINAILTYPTTVDVSQAKISGLPFAPAVCANILFGGNAASVNTNNAGQGLVDAASTTMTLVIQNNGSKTNALLSTLTLHFSGFYLV
jgi:hypothetical protein